MMVLLLAVILVPIALYIAGSILVKLFGLFGIDLVTLRNFLTRLKPLVDSPLELISCILRWLIRVLQFLQGLIERNANDEPNQNDGDRLYCLGFLDFGGAS